MPATRALALAAAQAAAIALLFASCATSDRGGTTPVVAMTFVTTDSQPDASKAKEFAVAVEEVSDGGVTVEPLAIDGTGADAARAVLAGEYDGAWIPTRYFADLDIVGFEALTAPMVVGNRDAALAVSAPAVAQDFLALLEDSGLVGIAIAPGELRRPLAADGPLLDLGSWEGRKLRALDATQVRAFDAWGATGVLERRSIGSGISAGTFVGGETDLRTQRFSGDASYAPYVTANVVLWSKPEVLVVRAERWESLGTAQREALQTAAEQVRAGFISTPEDEASLVNELCQQGVRFPAAETADVAGLRAEAEQVLAEMREDAVLGPLLSAVEEAAQADQETAALEVPAYCQGSVLPTQPVGEVPSTASALPPGTYRMHLTPEDISAAGLSRTNEAQVVTLTLGEDGSYTSASTFDDTGSSMVFEAGRVFGDGEVAYFVNDLAALKQIRASGESACVWTDPALQCGTNTEPYAVSWSLTSEGGIQFADPRGLSPDPIISMAIVAKPYVPVG